MTPMQQQYQTIKQQYTDAVVMFRLGDFYETFFDDAELVSRVLGITLTGRGKGEDRYAMAGIPHHALPNYLPKLVAENIKVVIADQTEEAVPGKLVERKITKIITPGTITDENSLDSSKNNFIAAIYITSIGDRTVYNVAYSDLTTGEFKVFNTNSDLVLKNEINKIHPSEVLYAENQKEDVLKHIQGFSVSLPPSILKTDFDELLRQTLSVQSLKAFGMHEDEDIIIPAGLVIWYLQDSQRSELKHIKSIDRYQYSDYMQLDPETIRNLELLNSNSEFGRSDQRSELAVKVSLFGVLNEAATPMGKRMLRSTIIRPFVNADMIQDRLDSVEFFFNEPILRDTVRDALWNVYDLERLAGKIGYGNAHPKDILSLAQSLQYSIDTCRTIHQHTRDLPRRINHLLSSVNYEEIESVIKTITDTIHEHASVAINEGGIFADGYNLEVDELRNITHNSKQILADIQKRETEATGIPSLKISYNNVFGYYIEVTNTHKDKVPDRFVRKQTLANAERYITQELKELEEKILTSEDKLIKLEMNLYIAFREQLAQYITHMQSMCKVISEIDLIASFAHVAKQYRFIKPILSSSNELHIANGRHPVVERLVDTFVANDTKFDEDDIVHILTGPNMSGKSTYIRQVALLMLMAHMGSFVPADSFIFSICDRVFTRVGAADNLAKGESTFMVEMIETANILNNATEKSLVILDEVGRGTSTYDGVAIAWSIVEYIKNHTKSKTLFATHYHELTALAEQPGIENYTVQVLEKDGEIFFQHKIIDGSASKSYGVHVAKLAGVPAEVVQRADEILKSFEGTEIDREAIHRVDSSKSEAMSNEHGAMGKKSKNKEQKTKKAHSSTLKAQTPKRPKRIHPEQMSLI